MAKNQTFRIRELQNELKQAVNDLESAGNQKPQFLINDDDEYQEQLELGWWVQEQRAYIDSIKKELDELLSEEIEPTETDCWDGDASWCE